MNTSCKRYDFSPVHSHVILSRPSQPQRCHHHQRESDDGSTVPHLLLPQIDERAESSDNELEVWFEGAVESNWDEQGEDSQLAM